MAKNENKTQKNDKSVEKFLNSVENKQKREDSFKILEMMKKITGEEPKMWGESIIGFGEYHYKYASGREGDWMKIGFSPRKQNLTLYVLPHPSERESAGVNKILEDLGKHKTSVACLYVNKLADVDEQVLAKLIKHNYEYMNS